MAFLSLRHRFESVQAVVKAKSFEPSSADSMISVASSLRTSSQASDHPPTPDHPEKDQTELMADGEPRPVMSLQQQFAALRTQSYMNNVGQNFSGVSDNMVKWTERLPLETIVVVKGVLRQPSNAQHSVDSATIKDREIFVQRIHILGTVYGALPFHIADAQRPEHDYQREDAAFARVSRKTKLDHRVASLRTDTSRAIFRIQAMICRLWREYLDDHGFMEIHSSKLQQGASESGASVFKVDYFGRDVTLTQSPQLAKQMAIASDFERVYEIGPVFRAENSNDNRHATEFCGLDLEMEIKHDYSEVLDMLDGVLTHILRGIQVKCRTELEIVRKEFPSQDLLLPEKTVRITFAEGVRILRESGYTEDGDEVDPHEDLSTAAERRLGELVREQYHTDFYILGLSLLFVE